MGVHLALGPRRSYSRSVLTRTLLSIAILLPALIWLAQITPATPATPETARGAAAPAAQDLPDEALAQLQELLAGEGIRLDPGAVDLAVDTNRHQIG